MSGTPYKIERVSGMPASDEDLLNDLRSAATNLNKGTVGHKEYRQIGKFDDTTISSRFGSWNNALRAAGLAVSNEINIPDDCLYENLLTLWQHFGRQPRLAELSSPPSKISRGPYKRRFGTWTNALEAFVHFANENHTERSAISSDADTFRRTTGRDASLRLRWHVLKRDRFSCCACGASPAISPGVELHVDHIVPWSIGGETVLENLQTLCSVCNLGKSNLHTG